MQDVYMPEFLKEDSWPDTVKKDFTGHLHKFMASVTEAVFEAKGKTVLYIPNEDLGSASDVARDKDLVQRLESTTIHWTRQIKEVVNQYEGKKIDQLISVSHPELLPGGLPSVLELRSGGWKSACWAYT